MKGGRKNLKRAIEEESLNLEECHNIMQVLSLVVSNLVEVMDAQGKKSLALFPAKFQKSMWIKRGSFVVVDGSGREKALESRSKVACIVSKVLFCEQVRASEITRMFWTIVESSDDDGLPPLKANTNRI